MGFLPLTVGTVLNERYRITSVLGSGGFGITYEAVNERLGLRVAVKELYWRGRTLRDGTLVSTADDCDATAFSGLKEHFLQEAKIMSSLTDEPLTARVIDYFEANGTAYIVMEYVEGITLTDYVRQHGPMDAETLFDRMLPLAECLGRIHRSGVIHRDISPNNLMIRTDGTIKLIDFGAAKDFTSRRQEHTAMASDSYAPIEQYDRHGILGPWTDVYALCASMYYAVTGSTPDSAVQRLFLDEMKKPSLLAPSLDDGYEAVLMRGLRMEAGSRYQSMEELAEAMRLALPAPKTSGAKKHRRLIALLTVAMILMLAGIGGFAWHQYDEAHPFRNVETETFIVRAPGGLSAADFVQAGEDLHERLTAFAGENNYRVSQSGTTYTVVLPLSCFGGQEIASVLKERFEYLAGNIEFDLNYQIQGNWEDPIASMTAGEYQVCFDRVPGETAVVVYAPNFDWGMSKGEKAGVLMDFKTRLDALRTPYAIGTCYGEENWYVIRISTASLNRFILFALGGDCYLVGEGNQSSLSLTSFNVEAAEEGNGLLVTWNTDWNWLTEQTDALFGAAESGKLYLASRYLGAYYKPIAWTDVTDAEDGVLEFTRFTLQGTADTEANRSAAIRLICAMTNETDFPTGLVMLPGNFNVLDEHGTVVFDNPGSLLYGQDTVLRDEDQ